jgi:spore coat protein U-like protein
MTKTLRIALLSAAAAALLHAADASAQTTAQFQVTASVAKNCVIDTATDIAITTAAAPWDPTTLTDPKATGTITVRCTRGTAYSIDVNNSTYADTMSDGAGHTLPYKFYAGDCTSDFTPISFTATSRAARGHTICAGLDFANAGFDPYAGDYSDTVVAEITF